MSQVDYEYLILIGTNDPSMFDALPAEYGWEATMSCIPTGDSWTKENVVQRTALTDPENAVLVEDTGKCSWCGEPHPLNNDGTVRRHKGSTAFDKATDGICTGSGQLPS